MKGGVAFAAVCWSQKKRNVKIFIYQGSRILHLIFQKKYYPSENLKSFTYFLKIQNCDVFLEALSTLHCRLGYTAKPSLYGLAYSSLCRLFTGWRSHNPQTDLNSSRKAFDPDSTHFLQTTRPKREGMFECGCNPWWKSATCGQRRDCSSAQEHRYICRREHK